MKDAGFWIAKVQGNLLPLESITVSSYEDSYGKYETILVAENAPGDGIGVHPYDFRKGRPSEDGTSKQKRYFGIQWPQEIT